MYYQEKEIITIYVFCIDLCHLPWIRKKSFLNKQSLRNHHIFTLIELLCVIAITMILVSLLLPAIHSVQNKAIKTHCQGNLRQLGVAFHLYGGDYAMRFPARHITDDIYSDGGINWAIFLQTYYNDVQLLDCSVSPDPAPAPTKESLHLNDGNYGWNFTGTQGGLGSYASFIRSPSQCYLLFDSGDPCIFRDEGPNWGNLMEELDLDFDSMLEGPNRHENQVNILYLDLHCESKFLLPFLAMPNARRSPPWYINWQKLVMTQGNIPYPER